MENTIYTLLICLALASCGATNSFNEYAQAGDTVALPVGMQADFSKDNISVTISPSSGADIVLTAGDTSIKGIVNLYPDPVSNMLVSRGIEDDITAFSQLYSDTLLVSANSDKDWYQTTVFLNLPTSLPTGTTQITVSNGPILGDTYSVTLEIIPGTGTAHSFNADVNGSIIQINNGIFDSLARADHTIVNIDSSSGIPHAVELVLSHDPDNTVGGTGRAFVVNPLGYLKNISWADDGNNMKIILMQSKSGIIDHMNDYKFYVSGTATNLQVVSVQAYDINGDVLTGITPTLTASN